MAKILNHQFLNRIPLLKLCGFDFNMPEILSSSLDDSSWIRQMSSHPELQSCVARMPVQAECIGFIDAIAWC